MTSKIFAPGLASFQLDECQPVQFPLFLNPDFVNLKLQKAQIAMIQAWSKAGFQAFVLHLKAELKTNEITDVLWKRYCEAYQKGLRGEVLSVEDTDSEFNLASDLCGAFFKYDFELRPDAYTEGCSTWEACLTAIPANPVEVVEAIAEQASNVSASVVAPAEQSSIVSTAAPVTEEEGIAEGEGNTPTEPSNAPAIIPSTQLPVATGGNELAFVLVGNMAAEQEGYAELSQQAINFHQSVVNLQTAAVQRNKALLASLQPTPVLEEEAA